MTEGLFSQPARILVTGAEGQVGRALVRLAAADPFFEVIGLGRDRLDITDAAAIRRQLDRQMPDYVVNCAEYNQVDSAERETALSYKVNRDGVELLALACGELSIPLLHLSTDYVFDGHYASGYTEEDEVAPLGVYGDSKWQGEERLRQLLPRHMILRVSWVFSEGGDNFVRRLLEQARCQDEISAVNDRRGCPTSAADIARVLLAILKQLHNGAEAWGTYHYCGAEVTTRYEFSREIMAQVAPHEELRCRRLIPVAAKDYPYEARRPDNSVLVCRKLLNTFGIRQRPWRSELSAVIRTLHRPVALED